MSAMQLIAGGFATVLTPTGIFLMLIGVAVGIVFGALPGLSGSDRQKPTTFHRSADRGVPMPWLGSPILLEGWGGEQA